MLKLDLGVSELTINVSELKVRLKRGGSAFHCCPRQTNAGALNVVPSHIGWPGAAKESGSFLCRIRPIHGVLFKPGEFDVHFEEYVTQFRPSVRLARRDV